MRIRDAHAGDAEGIAAIYNDAVVHTTAIWNEATVDDADRLLWLQDRQRAGFPVLVVVDDSSDEQVLGYASFGDWRAWAGYRHTVEHSVYVRSDQRGAGLGSRLLAELVVRARGMGKHVMVAGIEAGNTGSIALHRKQGFLDAGQLREVGAKFGTWLDLVFLQLVLDDRSAPTEA